MTVPYTNHTSFDAASGEPTCVAIDTPPRGIITRLVVKQVTGTLAGFDVDLHDSLTACGSLSSSAGDVDDELHQILATDTVAAAAAVSGQYNIAAPYVNQDPRDDRQIPTSKLYLEVTPAGSGVKTFQASWTISADGFV